MVSHMKHRMNELGLADRTGAFLPYSFSGNDSDGNSLDHTHDIANVIAQRSIPAGYTFGTAATGCLAVEHFGRISSLWSGFRTERSRSVATREHSLRASQRELEASPEGTRSFPRFDEATNG